MTDILSALQSTMWPSPAYSWLFEVQDATGRRTRRRADAVVCSCWPSNGLWLAGLEVKVSKSDWKRERSDPGKSWAIGRHCHYWWLATPDGLVDPSEVPEAWGLVTVDDHGKNHVRKQAPRREPEQLTLDFVASLFRNAADSFQSTLTRAVSTAKHEMEERLKPEAIQEQIDALTTKASRLESAERQWESHRQTLLGRERALDASIEYFCEDVGITREQFHDRNYGERARLLGVANAITDRNLSELADKFESLSRSLRELRAAGEVTK
jgi:FtsZ-binding cell division protein ZapB